MWPIGPFAKNSGPSNDARVEGVLAQLWWNPWQGHRWLNCPWYPLHISSKMRLGHTISIHIIPWPRTKTGMVFLLNGFCGIPAIVGQTTIQRSDGNSCKRVKPWRIKSASKSLKLIRWFTSSLKATQILYDSSEFATCFNVKKLFKTFHSILWHIIHCWSSPSTPPCPGAEPRWNLRKLLDGDLVKNLASCRSAWILSSENFGFLCFVRRIFAAASHRSVEPSGAPLPEVNHEAVSSPQCDVELGSHLNSLTRIGVQ